MAALHSSPSVTDFSVDQLKEYLEQQDIDEEIAEVFQKNKISGRLFLTLTPSYLKELFPECVGHRLIVSELIENLRIPSSAFSRTPVSR